MCDHHHQGEADGEGSLAWASERLFFAARTATGFSDQAVSEETLRQLWTMVRLAEAKERLLPALSPGNVDKTRKAPVTAVLGTDSEFLEHLPRLFPQVNVPALFASNPAGAEVFAFRNATLQAGYFILAARLLGLVPGPMSGFDPKQVDEAFFTDGRVRSNILVNLGYPDASVPHPRNPRLAFEEACRIA